MIGTTVVKFGGSSLANAAQIQKVAGIVHADPRKRFVVVSAPQGVTDLLFSFGDTKGDAFDVQYEDICLIYTRITQSLGVTFDPMPDLREIRWLTGTPKVDELVSRGEYLCAKIMAALLNFQFLDAAHFVRFDEDGVFDMDATQLAWSRLGIADDTKYVIPGFYGSMPNGDIKLFSRNASDVSAAIVAACARADLCQKWTDVSGIYRADPRIVSDAEKIDELTFREQRELTGLGSNVLHPEVIFPLRQAGIPIEIKNTNRPDDTGTLVVPDGRAQPKAPGSIVGISSPKDFTIITLEKAMMTQGYALRVLQVFDSLKIDIGHLTDGVDSISLAIAAQDLLGEKQGELQMALKDTCKPDMINVKHEISILRVVGHWMNGAPGTAGKIFTALGDVGINAELIDQGANQISIVVGVDNKDRDRAVNAIYDKVLR